MFNVIRSDLVKIKRSFWFKFLVFLWVSFFAVILSITYFQLTKENFYSWFFQDILWLWESLMVNLAIYVYIILWFSLLVDSLFSLDKWKDLILLTKNIRVKYFLSKVIIILFFSFLILFFIYLLSSLSLFLSSNLYNIDLFLKIFQENIIMLFIFYISILPILILFSFINLIWIRSIFIWILILFFPFINMALWDKIAKSDFAKYFDAINNYTLIWNYNNIIKPYYNNKTNYVSQKVDDKYISKKDIKDYEELNIILEKMTLINYVIPSMDLYNNSIQLDEYLKDKPETKKRIEKLNLLLVNDLKEIKDWDFVSKYKEIYDKLWWDSEFYDLQNKVKNIKIRLNTDYKIISSNSLKNIFSLNLDFYVWIFHIIFLLLVWSIIIKRRQVYN